ncbi:Disease resistance protein [Melia azedarach]|uniref:Disease resistance protein n=1 Tax=Melia azedarach TaxID=155640 RepID=A0ACC1Y4L6_MELAZ|nr:Disease resistance protein [Melia azedarach]
MEFIGPIIEILKCTGPLACKYVQYHRKLDENMEKLRRIVRELNSKNEDIKATLEVECVGGKLPKNEVNDWLQNIERIISKTQAIEEEVDKRKFFSRARLGKLVEEQIQEVNEYSEKGSSFTSLVIDAPDTSGLILETTTLAGERNKKILEEIWKFLMSDNVTKIGVYGMGGVGKTTILKHINNRLQEESNKFNDVIWVTVSQTLHLIELQNKIAGALKRKLPQIDDKVERAGKLSRMLKEKRKFVLILDDVWEALSLEEVGIPEPTEDNGCKLVISTRSLEVCRSMGCEEVKVEKLSREEALNLFLDKVGRSILQVPTLKETVESVANECAGLPLAIVTVASSMRGVEKIHEWRNALNELSENVRSVKGMDTPVFGRLEFSYNRLNDEKVQHCFLYCALYPEDYIIPKDELISYWIAEGILDEMRTVQAKYDRGHTILDRLENLCLLESVRNVRRVKMHDLIRDMALRITRKSPLFMINAGLNLQKFPGEEEWEENLQKASLMKNQIDEIPSDMSPNCPSLSALLLQRNFSLRRIPECFFVHMKRLKILDLSFTDIEDLPNSVSDLINLRSLLLQRCRRLQRIPSLEKLSALQYLDFDETGIEGVPEGMEKLKNLIFLTLNSKLEKFPTGILPNLHSLFKLRVYWGWEPSPKTVEEASKLSNQLDSFDAQFRRRDDFNIYVKSLGRRGPKSYRLSLNGTHGSLKILDLSLQLSFGRLNILDKTDKVVSITDCRIFEREDRIVLPKDVQSLFMRSVPDLIILGDVFSGDNEEGPGAYSSFIGIVIRSCHNLKKVFSPQLLLALQNLEVISMDACPVIEEIIALNCVGDKEEEKKELGRNIMTITLPRLRKLSLANLSSLKSICSGNGVMVCNSLEEIRIRNCPKLKRLSLALPLLDNGKPTPLPALKEINIEREIWESLEWDEANAKNVLNPYCNFRKIENRRPNLLPDGRIVQGLNNKKEDITATLEVERVGGKLPKNEVKDWLQNIERIVSQTQAIEEKVDRGKFFSRARLGKLVEEQIKEVNEYSEKGSSFTSLVIDAPDTSGLILETTTLAGERNKKILEEIWKVLMSDNVAKIGVYGELSRMLKRKGKFVLILDDAWEALSLEEVGIPEPTEDNGCKLVISTRSLEVCRSMGCEEVKVEKLSKEEALNLFLDKVGRSILQVPTLKEIVESVVEECAGLPLAIVTVAGCMRGVDKIYEWRNALNELSGNVRSVKGMDTPVFGRLEFSYNRLNDEKVQHCFLYCALYPEDFAIRKDELISEEEWEENLQKASLMYTGIEQIPSNMSPNCPRLSALLLKGNQSIQSIPECFFVHMQGLKILDLSYSKIDDLPNSVSDLINLRSLLLRYCLLLRRIPSLAKLLDLQYLDFEATRIQRVPEGLEKLKKLIFLNVDSQNLEKFPAGILPNLHCLFKLRVYWGRFTLRKTVEEAAKLSNQLDSFYGRFHRRRDFNIYVKSLGSQRPKSYRLTLCPPNYPSSVWDYDFCSRYEGLNILDKMDKEVNMASLRIFKREDGVVPPEDVQSPFERGDHRIVLPKDVQSLLMKGIFDLVRLNDVFSGDNEEGAGEYSSLRFIVIDDCVRPKKVFSPQLLSALQNLEVIALDGCDEIEDIIALDHIEGGEEQNVLGRKITLPRLRKLSLTNLSSLKSICSTENGVIVCNSLEEIQISKCPELKRLSLYLPLLNNGKPSALPALKAIRIEREIWESLDWDEANAKNVLNPYCKFDM